MSQINDTTAVDAGGTLELLILKAWEAVLQGDYAAAESILVNVDPGNATNETLHLLARLSVHKGDFLRAEQLWVMALKNDPEDTAAKAALARLRSRWLTVAVLKRFAYLVGLAAFLFFFGIGVVALVSGTRPLLPPKTTTAPKLPPPRPSAAIESPQLQSNLPPEPQQLMGRSASLVPPTYRPVPSIPGFSVCTTNGEIRITPDAGVFEYRCEFADTALSRLETVAGALQPFLSNHWVIVEGRTDAAPLPANSPFIDNFDLGLHRALAVCQLLHAKMGFSNASIFAASGRDTELPLPDDSASFQSRNRTVVFRLIPNSTISAKEVTDHESSR